MTDDESPIPTNGSADEKVPAYVQSVLDAVPEEDIRSIVEQAGTLLGSNEGRLKVAAQSGLALGVELAFRDMYSAYDMAISGMCSAVEKIDALMKESTDKQLILSLAPVRNSMARIVDACTNTVTEEERREGVVSTYGLPEELCDMEPADIGEFSIPASGLMALGITKRWPEMFQAYVVFRGDASLTCTCPWHTIEAWRGLSTEEASKQFDRIIATFVPGTEACQTLVQEFVQWWVNSARASYKATARGEEEQLKPPLVSEAESRLIADDIMARMGVGPKP